MNSLIKYDLSAVFQAVLWEMEQNRLKFNQADEFDGDHGDNMVAIFETAVQAINSAHLIDDDQPVELAAAMELAAQLLQNKTGNGSAQLYAHGLTQLGEQFRRYKVELVDLVNYAQNVALDREKSESGENNSRSGEVLKSLLAALAGWRQPGQDQAKAANPLDMGMMFDLGIAYIQAKQRNPTRLEAIADAAASVSPLSSVPHRYESGKLAIQALLQALVSAHPR